MSCGKWVPHQENMAQSHRGGQLCNMRPGLTWHKANKHFPESEKMQKGHTPKRKSGVRSAKVHLPDQEEEEEQDDTPQLDQNEKHHDVFVKMFDVQGELAEMIHTDQTGKFPVRSSKYNQCIMVFAKPESGVMLAQTVRDQITGETCETHQKSIHHLHTLMIHPKHQVLDNEASRQCKLTITKNAGSCHLIPPPRDDHRHDTAKKAIQTFKVYFDAILCGADPNFPMHLWGGLIPQAERMLILLSQIKAPGFQ